MAQKIEKPSSIGYLYFSSGSNNRKTAIFNHRGSYPECVSLLKQIEVATGMSSDKDILKGTTDILKEFSKNYGKDCLNSVMAASNFAAFATTLSLGNSNFLLSKFKNAQDILLETVFDKDYPQDVTLDSAKEYLDRMKEMESVRGRIEGDTYFKDFYNDKYEKLKDTLLQRGYQESKIDESISKYTPIEFHKSIAVPSNFFVYGADFLAKKIDEAGIKQINESDKLRRYHIEQNGEMIEVLALNGTVIHYNHYPTPPGFNYKDSLSFEQNQDGVIETSYEESYVIGDDIVKSPKKFEITPEGVLNIKDENGNSVFEIPPQDLVSRQDESELGTVKKVLFENAYGCGYSIPEINENLEWANQSLLMRTGRKLEERQKQGFKEKSSREQVAEVSQLLSSSKVNSTRSNLINRIKDWRRAKSNPQKIDEGKDNIPDDR